MTTETTAAPEASETDAERLPLSTYKGKKVKVTYLHMVSRKEFTHEGTVDEAMDESAILFKQRGRANGELILAEDIRSIELDASAPEIKQKTLKDCTLSTVRQHLADRHGWTLEDINDTTEEEAFRAHLDLDHVGISHKHQEAVEADEAADGEEPDGEEPDEDDVEDDEDDLDGEEPDEDDVEDDEDDLDGDDD